jgi:hypothetical protein
MAGAQQRMGQRNADSPPVKEGVLAGALAYVAGFFATFILLQVDSDLKDSLTSGFQNTDVSAIDATSWVYASAHFIVDMKTEVSGGGQSQSQSQSLFSNVQQMSLPEPVYYAVPIIVLAGAGYLVVQQTDVSSSEQAIQGGAALAAGYLPLALISAFVFRVSQSSFGTSLTFGPDLVMVGVTGLLFPVIFGAAGAYGAFAQSGPQRGGYQQQPPAQGGQQYQQGGQQYQQGGQQGGRQGRQRQQGGQRQGDQQGGRQQGGRQQQNNQRNRR